MADSLSKHGKNRKGLGTSSGGQYSWVKTNKINVKSKNDDDDGPRKDGLPNNALYAHFVKEGEYDPNQNAPDPGNISSGETFAGMSSLSTDMYIDINAGLMYYALFGDNTSIYVGGAMNHLNAPDVSLIENTKEEMFTRWIGHAGGEIPFTAELSLMPAIQVMGQEESFESNFGANFRYSNHDWRELAIRAGLWSRITKTVSGNHFDALVFTAILEVERWNIGVSYDMTTSNLNVANNSRGAVELSLIYVHPAKSRIKVNCPKF